MGTTTLRKTDKKCALCKHWNGTIGCTSIKPVPGGFFRVDMSEKQTCWVKTNQTIAISCCPKFEARY